ncbi:MAG: hypothetical protein PSX81_06045 [bacterium]|nr:hypothetical protein [bacterium]
MNIHLTLKTCFVLIAVLFVNFCKAQINLEFTSVNEYAFNTKEALNLIVTNGTTKPFNVIFNGRIKDASGQTVVEFKTHEATLNIGATIFSPQTIAFSETQYYNNDIAEIEASSGSYPSGNYSICVWATCTTPDCNGTGSSTVSTVEPRCIQIHIENPTPLLLATPENESEIETTRPLYTWIPPSPVAGSASLNYTMILVELLEGQTKADALSQNRPLIELEGIGNPALIHPSDIPELEKGKWYAWQVQAYVGKTPIAKSEQWKFKVKKKEEEKRVNRFFDLNQSNTAEIPKIKKGDKIFFTIENGMLNISPLFSFKRLDGKLISVQVLRVTKDSIISEFDEFSSDLIHAGLTKYSIETSQIAFKSGVIYDLFLEFSNLKTIFRFEIID